MALLTTNLKFRLRRRRATRYGILQMTTFLHDPINEVLILIIQIIE